MPYNKKCLFKWFPSLRFLPLLALLLVFSPGAHANENCGSCSPGWTPGGLAEDKGHIRYYKCLNSTGAYVGQYMCTGTCDAPKIRDPFLGGCVADDPPDDCSASVWGDLSGDNNDDSCGCPSPSVNNGFGSCVTCEEGQVIDSTGKCSLPCPGNLQLVNGSCGCLAGQVLGTFNGVQSCQPSSPTGSQTQGGGTLSSASGTTINVVNNSDGSTTTTTTINNNTTIVGGGAGSGGVSGGGSSGTGTISSGTSTISVTTGASGQIISATGTSQSEEAQDSLTLPAVLDSRELSIGDGISQAFATAPFFSALNSALGAFPTSGACSVISLSLAIPYNPTIHVNMTKQCDLFADIANYLTMFAMVIYGLLSYKAFIRSASGI